MIADKKREEFRVRINAKMSSKYNIEVNSVSSVSDLQKRNNVAATLSPARKPVVISLKK